jgi:hypothetical protein
MYVFWAKGPKEAKHKVNNKVIFFIYVILVVLTYGDKLKVEVNPLSD